MTLEARIRKPIGTMNLTSISMAQMDMTTEKTGNAQT
jgi:hypothetical protein